MQGESKCSWCGTAIEADDGYRAYEPAGERTASFCRLEHVVPWVIRGADWLDGRLTDELDSPPTRCSHCDAELGGVGVVLVHHRGPHRIADGFCSVKHMRAWAGAGGRWQVGE